MLTGFSGRGECRPGSHAGIALFDSDRNLIKRNETLLVDFGIVLFDSERNRVEKNKSADVGSDGNACHGIGLFNSDDNRLTSNVVAENRWGRPFGDGIHLDSKSTGNLIKRNRAVNNSDDGIDCENSKNIARKNITQKNDDRGIEGCTIK